MRRLCVDCVAAALLLAAPLFAQQGAAMATASDHTARIVKQTSPIFPPIAKAVHASGPVVLTLDLDAQGRITGIKTVSGHQMLVAAARTCVQAWQFEPAMQGGVPMASTLEVSVPFELPASDPNDLRVAEEFFPLDRACIEAVARNAAATEQVSACEAASAVAKGFAPDARYIERRSIAVYTSTALYRAGRFTQAVQSAEEAVAVVQQGHDDGSGSSAAYQVRAQAEAQLGELKKADEDLTVAERFERDAITRMEPMNGDLVKQHYVPVLRGLLRLHARISSALGQDNEAAAEQAEADRL